MGGMWGKAETYFLYPVEVYHEITHENILPRFSRVSH
jgi:hypothetical protein